MDTEVVRHSGPLEVRENLLKKAWPYLLSDYSKLLEQTLLPKALHERSDAGEILLDPSRLISLSWERLLYRLQRFIQSPAHGFFNLCQPFMQVTILSSGASCVFANSYSLCRDWGSRKVN